MGRVRKLYVVMVIVFLLIMAGCKQDTLMNNEDRIDEVDAKTDEGRGEEAQWMEEQNLHVTDISILQTRTNENLGPTITYSLFDEDRGLDAEGNSKLYISFDGDRFEFELGYFAPDRNELVIKSLHEQERKNKRYTLPYYDELFGPYIEKTEVTEFFEAETKWELTAADVTGDGELEIIYLVQARDPLSSIVVTRVAVYGYKGNQTEPFKLLTQFSGESHDYLADQHVYFTDGLEFVQDIKKITFIRAYFEDGKWYTEDFNELNNPSKSALFHYDAQMELQLGPYPNMNRSNDEHMGMDYETVDMNEGRQILTEPTAIDQLAKEDKQAGLDAIEYARRSTEARTEGDYDRVFELVKEGSPIDDELKKLIKDNQERGVELTYDGGTVIHTDVVSSGKMYDVTVRQSFYIYGVEREGLRNFETMYRMQYDNSSGNFQAVELLDEVEI